MRLFDLSLQHKLPLWGSILIVVSTLVLSAAFMFRAYDQLKEDLTTSSESLGRTLEKTLFPVLLHDDPWSAFEIVRAPFLAEVKKDPLEIDLIFVVNGRMQIVVASDPKRLPTLANLDSLSAEYATLAAALRVTPLLKTQPFDFPNSKYYYTATPIAEAGHQVGTLVITRDRSVFLARFQDLAFHGALIGLLVIALILPINWYWGRRMAGPLVELAHGMDALMQGRPTAVPAGTRYTYQDELGQLYETYRQAASVLQEKAMLEQEMLRSERLAAVGRLAAGIAHEVNNPVGGMLMALDNLRQRTPLDPSTAKTIGLIERGLQQVSETVGALLVEARLTNRPFTKHDFDDIRTLIEPQAIKKEIALECRGDLPEALSLPASPVRQILINLLLNAVQFTLPEGRIRMVADATDNRLNILVGNTGSPPSEEIRDHLFEPFVSGHEGGHGLGLWVTYQIVVQLGGQIATDVIDGEVRFHVTLPLERQLV